MLCTKKLTLTTRLHHLPGYFCWSFNYHTTSQKDHNLLNINWSSWLWPDINHHTAAAAAKKKMNRCSQSPINYPETKFSFCFRGAKAAQITWLNSRSQHTELVCLGMIRGNNAQCCFSGGLYNKPKGYMRGSVFCNMHAVCGATRKKEKRKFNKR